MVDTVVKVSNSQLSKNPDYKVLVEDILGSYSQVTRLNVGAPGTIQYWDGTTTASIVGEVATSIAHTVTVNAGNDWVEVHNVGDSITVTTSAMLGLVDDGTSHMAALRQPLTDTELRATAVPVSLASVPSHAVTNAGTFAVQVDGAALTALQSLLAGDTILIGTTAYTVKKQKIDRATSGELVAAVTGKKIRVIALYATVAADTTVTLKSASTTTGTFTTTGAMTWKAGGGMVLPRDPDGHIETTSGEALNVTLGTACQISGMLKYVEV